MVEHVKCYCNSLVFAGIHAWLQHKLATVNYVIVVCSAGARFKSVSARRAQLEQVRFLSLIFSSILCFLSVGDGTRQDLRKR